MTDTLRLSPSVLDWAAKQAGETLGELANRISKRAAHKIEQGDLTTPQAIKFAKVTGVPFGYLFLPNPPPAREPLPIADFRTLQESDALSKNFFDVFDDITFKQAWYRDYLASEGAAPLPFVGRFKSENADARLIAADIRRELRLGDDTHGDFTPEQRFAILVDKTEAAGILVFKNGIVGNNTHRPLSVAEFRGFVICDALAPMIFINGADAPAAWPFTLAHELAHIWLGESGVSDALPSSKNKHEVLCNAVAAEVLVPQDDFLKAWHSTADAFDVKINRLRLKFRVSALVIARRALDFRLATQDNYEATYRESRDRNARDRSSSTGGDFYASLAVRNSKVFSEKVASLATSGNVSFRQAGQLLNTNPNNVAVFHATKRALSS